MDIKAIAAQSSVVEKLVPRSPSPAKVEPAQSKQIQAATAKTSEESKSDSSEENIEPNKADSSKENAESVAAPQKLDLSA